MNLTDTQKQEIKEKIKNLKAQRAGLGNRLAGIETIFDGRSRYLSEKERKELYEEEDEIERKQKEIDEEIERLENLLQAENKPFRR